MTDDDMEIVGGTGNVFRDFGYPDADVRQVNALLAAQIIKVLDAEELSTRQAAARTGIGHSECAYPQRQSRALHDRPLGDDPRPVGPGRELSVTVHPRARHGAEPDTAHL